MPPTGRGVARFVSSPETARCAACRRALPRRLDGLVISHKSNGDRCPGSGQAPGEDLAVASWTPIIKGLTPHGLRHGLKVWMDEDQIADVLKSERLGHDEPGMRGVYGHVSPAMREELKAALQARWEESLRQRAALSPVSAVQLLNRLLAGIRPASKPVRSPWLPESDIGRDETRTADNRMPCDLRICGRDGPDLNRPPLRLKPSNDANCRTVAWLTWEALSSVPLASIASYSGLARCPARRSRLAAKAVRPACVQPAARERL